MAIPRKSCSSISVLIPHELHELPLPFFPAQRFGFFGRFIDLDSVLSDADHAILHRPAFFDGAFCCVLGRLPDALVPELHQLLQPLGLHLGHGPGLLVHLAHALEGLPQRLAVPMPVGADALGGPLAG